jgi:hypothetical protein
MSILSSHGHKTDARKRATAKFLEILADDFEANGRDAVERAREKDPIGYLRAIAALLPKDVTVEKPLDGLSDDELSAIIGTLRNLRAVLEVNRERLSGERQSDSGSGGRVAATKPTSTAQRSRRSGAGARRSRNGAGEADEPRPTRDLSAL